MYGFGDGKANDVGKAHFVQESLSANRGGRTTNSLRELCTSMLHTGSGNSRGTLSGYPLLWGGAGAKGAWLAGAWGLTGMASQYKIK
ncbi:hypothetical protein RRG08_036580 [Elysia crispata]|uniref:Uncharacterized protein n=1 Tax=Elysia crispata TaxID=231223 RepID=A0AAE0ZR35_9GAST|nr:hypothetical protein RRG08_036580 [Elysia crispata]